MESLNFHLEGVIKEKEDLKDFEGPLALILMLLKKNKIEIRDIKISDILDQYLDYIDKMQKMDLEIASEFIQMASYLVFIKTKTLLASDEEEVSELEILIESLEQLKAKDTLMSVKEVTSKLLEAYKTGSLLGVKPPEPLPKTSGEYEYFHTADELLEALKRAYSNADRESVSDVSALESAIPKRMNYSVREKSRDILLHLKSSQMSLSSLYDECRSRSELIATFLSVLELCSMGSIRVTSREDGYEIGFIGGNIDEILENIED